MIAALLDEDGVMHAVYAGETTPYMLSMFTKHADLWCICSTQRRGVVQRAPRVFTCLECTTALTRGRWRWHDMVKDG